MSCMKIFVLSKMLNFLKLKISLDSYISALEMDDLAEDLPYRILPLIVKSKHSANILKPLEVGSLSFTSSYG